MSEKPMAGVVRVTPEVAAEWLEGKHANRNVSERVVARYAQDMKEGRWLLNGQPIIFDKSGALLDGQHRLWAVIESGLPVEMLVVGGVEEGSMVTMDTGRARGFADVLQIAGRSYTREVASAARWVLWYESESGRRFQGFGATHGELLAVVETHPSLQRSARAVGMHKRAGVIVSRSILTFIGAYAVELDGVAFDEWLDALALGRGLQPKNPALVLRERMITEKGRTTTLAPDHVAAMAVKSWNAFYSGEEIARLTWTPEREGFPHIQGSPRRRGD